MCLSVCIVSWMKFSTFNRSMLFWVWPPEVEATGIFFGLGCSSLFPVCFDCSCESCSFWLCLNNLIWFLRSLISLSLLVDVCFYVEGTLVGNFPQRCCVWAGCSNSSFSLKVCFAGFSQMLSFSINDIGVFLNVICIRFLEVCLSYCRCLLFCWLGFIF